MSTTDGGPAKGAKKAKWPWIVGGVFALLIIIGMSGEDKPGAGSPSAEQAAAPTPPIAVTAKELAAAYEENEAAAQLKFGKSVLNVTANISAIQLGIGDKPFLVLEGTNQFMGPQAQLDEAGQAQAATLKKGQKISLTCQKVSEVVATPMLEGCSITADSGAPAP